ncbi:TPA: hypothetical protein DEP90_01485 [Patescibacteria group bacterium]|nr:hypothetical protein [Patescibacteria group bacterium]
MALKREDMVIIQNQIEELSSKMIKIESKVLKIDKEKEFDYQKVLATIKYLYRYYDDMSKDKITP